MQATHFMRKPFVVTGYRVDKDNMETLARWCQGQVIEDERRPFVRVPVDRPLHRKQTEAHIGCWIVVSVQEEEKSFKVFSHDWILKHFDELPPIVTDLEDVEIRAEEPTCTRPHVAPSNVLPLPMQNAKATIFSART